MSHTGRPRRKIATVVARRKSAPEPSAVCRSSPGSTPDRGGKGNPNREILPQARRTGLSALLGAFPARTGRLTHRIEVRPPTRRAPASPEGRLQKPTRFGGALRLVAVRRIGRHGSCRRL